MTQAVAHILEEADQLSAAEREELADCLMERISNDIPPEIMAAQLAEVRRRIDEIESGKVQPIPGDEALERVRRILVEKSAAI